MSAQLRPSCFSGTLILVNRKYPLLQEPNAEELRPVDCCHPEILLQTRAKIMLDQLLQAVGGESSIVPVSGYRPKMEQQQIWDDALAEHGRTFTETYVAWPGCSEHQTGLAIDLGENRPEIDFLCPAFPDAGICQTFRMKAPDYGFVLRYPKGRETVTGIGHEPWHFRYVGWPHARMMTDRGLVLEEYIDLLRGYPEKGPHLLFTVAGRGFELFFVPDTEADGLEKRLPSGLPVQVSRNNVDGLIVTIWRDTK